MKLTEAMVSQISEVPKLRYLLVNLIQKTEKLSQKNKLLQKQLIVYRDEITDLKESKNKGICNSHEEFEFEFEKSRADFNEFAFHSICDLLKNGSKDNNLGDRLEDFNTEVIMSSQKLKLHYEKKLNEQFVLIEDQRKQITEIHQKIEEMEKSPISKDIEKLISEKEESISKLKSMLQRSVKSDQRKQVQIEELQNENNRLMSIVGSGVLGTPHSNVELITRQEMLIQELQERLANSQPNIEMEQKFERLQSMLEASNSLYTSLKEKVADDKCIPNKCDLSAPQLFEIHYHKEKKIRSPDNESLSIVQVRKALLQYFLTDHASQHELIPIILNLVGCKKDQINTALHRYETQNQIINRTGGFFGLFG